MKRTLTSAVFLATMVFFSRADDTNTVAVQKIGAKEAGQHYDETLTVTGKVAQVTVREKLVFLNLDQPHPNSPFTAVIFAAKTNQFGDLSQLKDKDVEITGKVKKYNDSPEMVLDGTNQLKLVNSAEADKAK